MIRIDAVWLATEPRDMRAGTDTALARGVKVFGSAHPHPAYLFAKRGPNRMKVLVSDGVGHWLTAQRPHQRHLAGRLPTVRRMPACAAPSSMPLVLGLP